MNKLIVIVLVCLFAFEAFADGVKFTASAPPKVGVGQQFTVKYVVNASNDNFTLGAHPNFKLLGGPYTSTSTSWQSINGSVSQSVTYTYSYTFSATTAGRYTIEPATVVVDGTTYKSNSLPIEVQKDPVNNGGSGSSSSRRRSTFDPFADFFGEPDTYDEPQTTQNISADDIFITASVNKTNLYKGEQLTVTYKIYTRVNLSSIDDITFPAFDSFYAEELDAATQLNFKSETYKGQRYNVAFIKSYVLYPRVAGSLTIEPAQMECTVLQPGSRRSFFSNYVRVNRTLKSNKINLNIKDLPPAPAGFSGAIGNFRLKFTQSADSVNVNEAVSFKLTISGTGNFNMIDPPKIRWSKEFEVYDPVADSKVSVTNAGLTGSKSWEYTVIPRYPGNFDIGQLSFQYFDIASQSYKTLTTNELHLIAGKDGSGTAHGGESFFVPQKNVEYIGDESIRFVKRDLSNLRLHFVPLACTWRFGTAFIAAFAIFVLIIVILRKKIKENADLAAMKVKKAGKISRKRLRTAKKYMQNGNRVGFYKEIITALWGYAGDRLQIPVANLTKDNIIATLEERHIDPQFGTKFTSIIDECEFAHFAPASQQDEMMTIYKKAVDIIEELEQKIK